MTQRKKLKNKISKKRRHKGGTLMSKQGDLINTHLMPSKKKKETTGQEIFMYNGTIYQLNSTTFGFLKQVFNKSNDKWFKFIIFNNDGEDYIYIINGGQINKHSVCMLMGLLDVTKDTTEYEDLRMQVKALINFKMDNNPFDIFSNTLLREELELLIQNIDALIEENIPNMPVIAAGSGTVNDDDTICINNKSGHYKPNETSMEIARDMFMQKTGASVYITEKADKNLLREKYGDDYENYSGICL